MYHQNPAIDRLLRLAHLLLLGAAVFAFYKVLFPPLLPLGVAFLLYQKGCVPCWFWRRWLRFCV